NPEGIQNHISELEVQAQEMKERFENDRENPTHLRDMFIRWNDLEPRLQQRRQLRFADILSAIEGEFDAYQQSGTESLMPTFSSANSYGGRLRGFVQDCRNAVHSQQRIVGVTAKARR